VYKNNALWFKNRGKGTIKKRNMQENVRFFYIKLHKNAYFSVCEVHKIAKSVISIGQKSAKCANYLTDRRAGDKRHKTEKQNK
jgi:hypothetical protein